MANLASNRSLRSVLESHNPQPSEAFYRRMAQAPWNQERGQSGSRSWWHLSVLSPSFAAVAALVIVAVVAPLMMAPPDVRAGVLSIFGWRPVGSDQPAPNTSRPNASVDSKAFAGDYSSEGPAASSPGRKVMLTLVSNMSVTWTTDYKNGRPPIKEVGTWEVDGPGRVTVTVTGSDQRAYSTPRVVGFELRGDELFAVEYDPKLFGSMGLQLWREK